MKREKGGEGRSEGRRGKGEKESKSKDTHFWKEGEEIVWHLWETQEQT